MFDIIVAVNQDSLIGVKEYGVYGLPWPMLREDMRYFRSLTANSVCIVGYNTALTLPKNFETGDRQLIVVDRSTTFETALTMANATGKHIAVIGGSAVYSKALKHPDLNKIYCTVVEHSWPKSNEAEELIYFPVELNKLPGHCSAIRYYHDKQTNISMSFQILCTKSVSFYRRVEKPQPVARINDPYYDLIQKIMTEGIDKTGRNGETRSIFGHQLVFDLAEGYPINTLKRCYPKAIFEELMWMIRGQTDAKILQAKGVNVWNGNSSVDFLRQRGLDYREGDIGPGYGFQMRHAGANYMGCDAQHSGIDQLNEVIKLIQTDPSSRRMIINLWDVTAVDKMALPPCHMVYQFGVNQGKLDCHLFQRSWDVMLGWNSATAALLTYLLAHHCHLQPGKLVHSVSDCHIYHTHFPAVEQLLARKPRPYPKLSINQRHDNIESYEFTDLVIENYLPCPAIKMTMVA